ncbi:hypothetical protein BXZ70DRAFT_364654 [Cristinia sonorae]|uniref:Extracellular serine-rich protein n=1 Tax=Cristinia sonorae TaxID=1940300 RepID=A0A8K0UKG6_9AGAR|nr:hypothetical protein BXZ70DRAFT_364654 [Cristinia sonorae]
MLALTTALLSLAAVTRAQDQVVQVGATAADQGGVFQFIPPWFNATVGSVITFNFSGVPGNHSVTQSSFSDPCTQLDTGFSSGFLFIPPNSTEGFPTWNVTVLSEDPVYFFCAQPAGPAGPHCFNGMVGGINIADDNFTSFQNNAKGLLANWTASTLVPAVPTGALSGSGAAASAAPLVTGSFVAVDAPTGSLSVSPSASGTGGSSPTSGGGSGTSGGNAPSPTGGDTGAAEKGAVFSAVAVVMAVFAGSLVLM